MKHEYIYRVSFKAQPLDNDPRTDFFFSSMSAIYEVFTPEQIGCKVNRLWNYGVGIGCTYENALCTITQHKLTRKAQNKRLER